MASTKKSAKKSAPAARKSAAAAPTNRKTDWQAVERDYRTGKFTLRELEDKHGADNSLIARRAKRDGWTQDLSVAIRQATKAKLIKAADPVADAVVVNEAAELNKHIILTHRRDVQRARDLAMGMFGELERQRKVAKTLPVRAKVLRSLSESMAKMVALEREAFDIAPAGDQPPPPPSMPNDVLAVEITAIRARIFKSLGRPPIEVQA